MVRSITSIMAVLLASFMLTSQLTYTFGASATWYPPWGTGFYGESALKSNGVCSHNGYATGSANNGYLGLWTQEEALGFGQCQSQARGGWGNANKEFPFALNQANPAFMNALMASINNQEKQEEVQLSQVAQEVAIRAGLLLNFFDTLAKSNISGTLAMVSNSPVSFTPQATAIASVTSNVKWTGNLYAYVVGIGQAIITVKALLFVWDETLGNSSTVTMSGIPADWQCNIGSGSCNQNLNEITTLSASYAFISGHTYEVEVDIYITVAAVAALTDVFARADFFTESNFGIWIQWVSFNY